jgi:hypothetical protein
MDAENYVGLFSILRAKVDSIPIALTASSANASGLLQVAVSEARPKRAPCSTSTPELEGGSRLSSCYGQNYRYVNAVTIVVTSLQSGTPFRVQNTNPLAVSAIGTLQDTTFGQSNSTYAARNMLLGVRVNF